jgi:hypothetical protein
LGDQVTQREEVYLTIKACLAELGIKHEDGECFFDLDTHSFNLKLVRLRSSEKIRERIRLGTFPLKPGKVPHWSYPEKIVSERLRLDRRLNGDVKHLTKHDIFLKIGA